MMKRLPLPLRLPLLAAVCLLTTGCCILGIGDCDDEIISVDNIFWTAWRNPETFDAWLQAASVDPAAPGCLRYHGNRAFSEEQNQLMECGQLLTGSPEWNECHTTAENIHNRGVVLTDIARACDGTTRFDATSGGLFLIQAKSLVGEEDWNSFSDILDQSTPPLECER